MRAIHVSAESSSFLSSCKEEEVAYYGEDIYHMVGKQSRRRKSFAPSVPLKKLLCLRGQTQLDRCCISSPFRQAHGQRSRFLFSTFELSRRALQMNTSESSSSFLMSREEETQANRRGARTRERATDREKGWAGNQRIDEETAFFALLGYTYRRTC